MKNIIKISFIALSLIFIASCNSIDFGDTNIDPNNPSEATTSALLTNAERYVGLNYTTATTPNMYVQYLAAGDYDDESRYLGFNFSYNTEYADILRNLKEVIKICQDPNTSTAARANGSLNNQIAVAKLLRAYIFWTMTDRWGMLPYSESLQGLEIKFPKYDSQENIYKGCFLEIDEALAIIDGGSGPTGDIMFGGDMIVWAKFANTLRVIMALRISKQVSSVSGYAAMEFNKGISGAITSNTENLSYSFLAEDTNDSPWQDRFQSRKDYILADTFVNALIGTGTTLIPEDPRLEKFGEKSTNALEYAGGIYGTSNSTANFSFITDDIINNQLAPGRIFTYTQIAFSKAEAVTLGWMSGTVATFYDDGVQASMEQWGVSAAAAATYKAAHPYTNLSDVAYQKWIALYMQGYESWAEWRRFNALGVAPTLKMITNAINGNGIPQRHAYPSSAPTLNESSYNTAVATQGSDDLDTKVWWAL